MLLSFEPNSRKSWRSLRNHLAVFFSLGFQHLPWDPANVNAQKNMFGPYIMTHSCFCWWVLPVNFFFLTIQNVKFMILRRNVLPCLSFLNPEPYTLLSPDDTFKLRCSRGESILYFSCLNWQNIVNHDTENRELWLEKHVIETELFFRHIMTFC